MWEVLSFGDKPYGEMSNQEVSLVFLTPPGPSPNPPQPFLADTPISSFCPFICIPNLSGPLHLMPCCLDHAHPGQGFRGSVAMICVQRYSCWAAGLASCPAPHCR